MFRGITLHSTLSCNTILCSKSSAWKQEDFCIAIKYIFKTLNFFWSSSKKASFLLMHYSIVIYIYIFIYIFFSKKKKKKLTPPMNQCNLYRTIKEDRHWGCTHGRKRSTALHHVSREQQDEVTFCWSRAAVLGDTCDNCHNTGIFRTLKTENDGSLVRNFFHK